MYVVLKKIVSDEIRIMVNSKGIIESFNKKFVKTVPRFSE